MMIIIRIIRKGFTRGNEANQEREGGYESTGFFVVFFLGGGRFGIGVWVVAGHQRGKERKETREGGSEKKRKQKRQRAREREREREKERKKEKKGGDPDQSTDQQKNACSAPFVDGRRVAATCPSGTVAQNANAAKKRSSRSTTTTTTTFSCPHRSPCFSHAGPSPIRSSSPLSLDTPNPIIVFIRPLRGLSPRQSRLAGCSGS
ncbi:hypothetical protein LX32DRAFT_198863 [Colletotrichum zoysiae]|uniref:Uncharacterized protein n=1 Tax=Colletotrichum zoysiae TaxID=1216348 RepID=A0AAD9M8A7_9PEZI|nr:hypothetical protein LX32DRAFT_198863 [Colletotrichum zoysiae]